MTIADEKKAFFREWFDYVNQLSGPMTRRRAWEYYLSEREFVLKAIADGRSIWRHVVIPRVHEPASAGETAQVGRFWTLSKTTAISWVPGDSYSEGQPLHVGDTKAVVYEALAEAADLDLVGTIACRLGSTWEDEIRLLPDRPVTIHAVIVLEEPSMANSTIG